MGVYFQTDIKTFDDGEIDISSGDFELASPLQSQRQLLINAFSTTRGGYLYDALIGWGCERYFGKPNNSITFETMRNDINTMLNKLDDLMPEDIYFEITKLEFESCVITIVHKGEMVNENDEFEDLVLSWKFIFNTGAFELWEVDDDYEAL